MRRLRLMIQNSIVEALLTDIFQLPELAIRNGVKAPLGDIGAEHLLAASIRHVDRRWDWEG